MRVSRPPHQILYAKEAPTSKRAEVVALTLFYDLRGSMRAPK